MFRKRLKHKKLTSNQVGLKHGFRSGLEEAIADELRSLRVLYEFEETKLKYIKPVKTHTYTPDFYLPKQKIFIETKGLFTSADRQKMKLVKEQHPDKDIRFIFSNSKSRISKKSKTTYAMWCDKYGFKWADKHIPKEWLNE
jgi:hypothetical protein|nr:endodeoxyribonuclease I [Methylophilales phage MEP432]|tara:strand:+ start:5734 stop:6156 length:423 start_codon:yes stop_codon:yes gene_type:complete